MASVCVICGKQLCPDADGNRATTHRGDCRREKNRRRNNAANARRRVKFRQYVSRAYFKMKSDPVKYAAYKAKRASYFKKRYHENREVKRKHGNSGRARKRELYKCKLISEFHKLLNQMKELAMSLDILEMNPSKIFDFKKVDSMTLEEAISAYEKVFEFTSASILYMAKLWNRIKELDGDTSKLHRSGFVKYLESINEGTVSAKAVAVFAEKPSILRRITQLPVREQERLASGGSVPLVVDNPNGNGPTVRKVKMTDNLPNEVITQIFGDRYIRDESEQIKVREINQASRKSAPIVRSAKRGKVHVDRTSGMVQIGKATAPIEDVISALRAIGAIV